MTLTALTRTLDRSPRPPAVAEVAVVVVSCECLTAAPGKTPAAVIAIGDRTMTEFEFVSRRSEYNRNVVRIRAPREAPEDAVIEYAKQVGRDSNPFGCQVRRYGDEVEVAFYAD
jgi:hypothetical protein